MTVSLLQTAEQTDRHSIHPLPHPSLKEALFGIIFFIKWVFTYDEEKELYQRRIAD